MDNNEFQKLVLERLDLLDLVASQVAKLTTQVDGLTTRVDGLTTKVDGLTTKAVSYTHLDVYKRQTKNCRCSMSPGRRSPP